MKLVALLLAVCVLRAADAHFSIFSALSPITSDAATQPQISNGQCRF
jgi:hypothetical protein